jgi:hypothetical protein
VCVAHASGGNVTGTNAASGSVTIGNGRVQAGSTWFAAQ